MPVGHWWRNIYLGLPSTFWLDFLILSYINCLYILDIKPLSEDKNSNLKKMQMFIAALFTISKTWMQPKCPSTDEWIKKMWYIYTMEYYSVIIKNEILPFATTWRDLEIIILSEISPTKKDKYHMWNLKKMIQMNLFIKQRLTDLETSLITKEESEGKVRFGVWDWYLHTAIFKIKWLFTQKKKTVAWTFFFTLPCH